MKWLIYATAILLGGTHGALAQTAANPKDGRRVFLQCQSCHSLEPGRNGVGPSLNGLFGRQSGIVPAFKYSAAMKNANITWSEETLLKYLQDPKAMVPGDKMAFAGVKDEQKRRDVVAYLNEATK